MAYVACFFLDKREIRGDQLIQWGDKAPITIRQFALITHPMLLNSTMQQYPNIWPMDLPAEVRLILRNSCLLDLQNFGSLIRQKEAERILSGIWRKLHWLIIYYNLRTMVSFWFWECCALAYFLPTHQCLPLLSNASPFVQSPLVICASEYQQMGRSRWFPPSQIVPTQFILGMHLISIIAKRYIEPMDYYSFWVTFSILIRE